MTFTFRPVDPDTDTELLHGWLVEPRARYWGMLTASLADVRTMLTEISQSAHREAFLGCQDGNPAFLMERYDPVHEPVGEHYVRSVGDAGMHLLVAPSDTPVHGFTLAVMRAVMVFLFTDPAVGRVVVEPDARNEKILALNAAVGFRPQADVPLPGKTARLSLCTRESFLAGGSPTTTGVPTHLSPEHWRLASRQLLRKALAEFAHERLLQPQETGSGVYRLLSDDGATEYLFHATRRHLDHWSISAPSIRRRREGEDLPLDVLEFMLEFRHTLAIAHDVLPLYLEEISSTLAASAYKLENSRESSRQLAAGDAHADAAAWGQRIERSMTEGHPCFVANNGRLGFGLDDYRRYAPETGARVHLVWIAVLRRKAVFSSIDSLDYDTHLRGELGERTLDLFRERLATLGLDDADYLLMPLHPWQWDNKVAITYAADVARQHIVYLGVGEDTYQAQQSIRTFFNLDAPERCYVKTALSVLNMGFMRGLSPQYMRNTPAINDWLQGLVADDPQLQAARFDILREVAAIGYHNGYYEAAGPPGSPYGKMLSALWRESPLPQLEAGERVATMASLLHRDANGLSFVAALIATSGIAPADWLRAYLRAYLVPLVHCLYAYELAFMPHGENVILVLHNGVPVRMLMKDIAEEIVVMGERMPLPPDVDRIRAAVPAEEQVLAIFTDVFDCFFRFLADALAEDGLFPEEEFWSLVADTVTRYQHAAPHLAEAFARHDLFADEFPRSCLNRLQLRNNRQMLDLADPSASLQMAGNLDNPIARYRRG
ncbi:hypothetical protein GY21_19510 [Cryobacterium roopkundense]|uniref:Lysine N-acyltransferase MbtK n=2 Tax=Cryobacterium roopkundense TaxID=1001240 RepID=A0A099J0Y4_9MICO|nr:hypothetical protein GY21_19510 [Cryobacterium roopkundense]MBB5641253.1 siderophore synthetase component [Cryobacterium roopkundense]